MDILYSLLLNPSKELFEEHSMVFFNPIIRRWPAELIPIVRYINDCYNYKSPLLVQEKAWEQFLLDRFKAHKIPERMKEDIIYMKGDEFVIATEEFLKYQKEPVFETLVLKQNFRVYLMSIIRDFSKTLTEKKMANETITILDAEINTIMEGLRQAQQPMGNYKGYDAIVSARSKIKISIASFID